MQYTTFDLANYIYEKTNENPLIEVLDNDQTKDLIVNKYNYSLKEFAYNQSENEVSLLDFIDANRHSLHDHLMKFELKHFFGHSINGVKSGITTTSYVKEIIKVIVEKENKLKPLSDQCCWNKSTK